MPLHAVRLKSKSGCLTCVARKKKCDEKVPRCGHCERLGLACRSRSTQVHVPVTSTNMRGKTVSPQLAISNGYPPFANDLERRITMASSKILAPFVSRVAVAGFSDMPLLGRFCVQNRLVREAIVAFSLACDPCASEAHYKISLRSYQRCITGLQGVQAHTSQNTEESIFLLTAICFLGLLEGLKLGSSTSAVTHFDMCRKLLVSELSRMKSPMDPRLMSVLRIFAECVLYNLASLTPFCTTVEPTLDDWGDVLGRLFPGDGASTSPFLGGLQGIYRVQLRIHMLLRGVKPLPNDHDASQSHVEAMRQCSEQLDKLERQVSFVSANRAVDVEAGALYDAKHRISILAARIHLRKVAHPSATSLDHLIQVYVVEAITILKKQDIREPGNPAMRWPLTVLACASTSNEDFELVTGKMHETEGILDPANSRKLATAYTMLHRHRRGCAGIPLGSQEHGMYTQPIDFLLMPQLLDDPQI